MGISFISELWVGIRCAFRKPVTLDKNTILKKSQKYNHNRLCIDPTECIKCKNCMFICPNKCIQILDMPTQDSKNFKWDETRCVNCRLCENSCPKKAINWVKISND